MQVFIVIVSISNNKTILLTGATGYLGGNVLKELVHNTTYKIIILKRSFSDTKRIIDCLGTVTYYNLDEVSLEEIFLENNIDIILHCATDYGRKSVDPMQVIEANLILPVKLLELGKNHGITCFINTDTILDKRINHYSLSKKQFKDWLFSYRESIACVNVTLEHFYGPFDDKTKFVSYIVNSLLEDVEKIDLTKGEQKRDFVFIEDVVNAFSKIIDSSAHLKKGFFEFEIGSDSMVTIKELVLMIAEIMKNTKTALHFGALPYRENEVMEGLADVTAIKKLGWSAQYSLYDGLKKMIDQELQEYNKNI